MEACDHCIHFHYRNAQLISLDCFSRPDAQKVYRLMILKALKIRIMPLWAFILLHSFDIFGWNKQNIHFHKHFFFIGFTISQSVMLMYPFQFNGERFFVGSKFLFFSHIDCFTQSGGCVQKDTIETGVSILKQKSFSKRSHWIALNLIH